MFAYDGDGIGTATSHFTGITLDSTTSYYFGGSYEVTGGVAKKYYSFGGQTIMRDANGLQYFLTDHLGSTVAITDDEGTLTSQQRYLPFGGVRADVTTPNPQFAISDLGYTGQRDLDPGMGGLMDYKARFYSPLLGKFIQPDTITPGGPQGLNRYSYVTNNPVNFNDPTGHKYCDNASEDDCTRFSNSIEHRAMQYRIRFKGNWKDHVNEQLAVLKAVEKVGAIFASERGNGESGSDAFGSVYGHITMKWEGDAGTCGNKTVASGGCTDNAHYIRFWSLSGHGTNDMTRMIKNVVHELGHAYDNSLSSTDPETGMLRRPDNDMSAAFTRGSVLRVNPIAGRWDWQQSADTASNEVFADMFVAWTYNAWNTSTDPKIQIAVGAAQDWMNGLVP